MRFNNNRATLYYGARAPCWRALRLRKKEPETLVRPVRSVMVAGGVERRERDLHRGDPLALRNGPELPGGRQARQPRGRRRRDGEERRRCSRSSTRPISSSAWMRRAARCRAAQSDLDRSRSEEARFRDLLERGLTTRAQYQAQQTAVRSAEAKLSQATAELRLAQQRLGYTTLRADQDGVVTRVSVEAGHGRRGGSARHQHRAAERARSGVRCSRWPHRRTAGGVGGGDQSAAGRRRRVGRPRARDFAERRSGDAHLSGAHDHRESAAVICGSA